MDDGKNEFHVNLIDGLEWWEVPIDFVPGYITDERDFFDSQVFEWIQDRVIPPGRQNINEILEEMGLSEYSELGIFLFFNGRCCRDYFRIEEI